MSDHSLMEEAARLNKRLRNYRTLELNADFQPLRWCPLKTQPWTEVMRWIVKQENLMRTGLRSSPIITVLETYPDVFVRSSGGREIPLPSVIAHTSMIPPEDSVSFTRFNLYLRDRFTCQYTGRVHPPSELTFDHVIPKSQGGPQTWTNIVTASQKINELKGDMPVREFEKRYGYKLMRQPYKPTIWEMREIGRSYKPKNIPSIWNQYLTWKDDQIVLDETHQQGLDYSYWDEELDDDCV